MEHRKTLTIKRTVFLVGQKKKKKLLRISRLFANNCLNMSVELFNSSENTTMGNRAVVVQDAHKRYSDIISMRGLNMTVTTGSMYVYMNVILVVNGFYGMQI